MSSLLPGNVSDLERGVEVALARLSEIDVPIATLWNPWSCPLEVLPYLAWAVSVDMWRADWPETIKRQVVATSLSVHAIKGTRPAVEQALAALSIDVEMNEWFQLSPPGPRGTFELVAWVNENLTPDEPALLNQALYDLIKKGVDNAKNTRSHYNFKVGARFALEGVGIATGMTGLGALTRREANAYQDPLESQTSVQAASVFTGVSLARTAARCEINALPKASALLVGGVCQGVAIIRTSMEITV